MVENRIKERCQELGVTHKWLAEKSGVPESTISEVQSGLREPRVAAAIRIARALNTTVENLFIVP